MRRAGRLRTRVDVGIERVGILRRHLDQAAGDLVFKQVAGDDPLSSIRENRCGSRRASERHANDFGGYGGGPSAPRWGRPNSGNKGRRNGNKAPMRLPRGRGPIKQAHVRISHPGRGVCPARLRSRPGPISSEQDEQRLLEVLRSRNWGGYPFPNQYAWSSESDSPHARGGATGAAVANGTVAITIALRAAGCASATR